LFIAYSLIALVVIGVAAAIYYVRRQSHREVYRRQRKRDREKSHQRVED